MFLIANFGCKGEHLRIKKVCFNFRKYYECSTTFLFLFSKETKDLQAEASEKKNENDETANYTTNFICRSKKTALGVSIFPGPKNWDRGSERLSFASINK